LKLKKYPILLNVNSCELPHLAEGVVFCFLVGWFFGYPIRDTVYSPKSASQA
jgi:hypothetical protein